MSHRYWAEVAVTNDDSNWVRQIYARLAHDFLRARVAALASSDFGG